MRVNVHWQAEGGEDSEESLRSAGVYAAAMLGGRGETKVRERDSVRREKGDRKEWRERGRDVCGNTERKGREER